MSIFESIIMGLIQGITEFLPVSSSGHLAIFKSFFGLSDVGNTFDVFLHVGTLAAIAAVYYKDIWELIVSAVKMIGSICRNIKTAFQRIGKDSLDKESYPYTKVIKGMREKFVILIIISTIPTAIVGALLNDIIEKASEGLLVPGICLLITGVALLIADRMPNGRKTIRTTRYSDAVLVGCAQAVAVFPGISRSGATISAALCCGYKKSYAVKYSFILSIPAILGAAVLKVADISTAAEETAGAGVGGYVIGMLVAAVTGYFALRLLIRLVQRNKYRYFAYYCFIIGIVAIVGFFVKR